MYDNNIIIILKQKKRKFEPRIKLNHNMYILNMNNILSPFTSLYLVFPFQHFVHALKFLIQTGVPPDDTSLCDFQAWLLSFTGMWLSVY